MIAQRNFAPAVGLLLVAVGVFGYFGMVGAKSTTLNPWLELPLFHLALVAAGLVLSAIGLRRAWSGAPRYRGRILAPLLGVVNVALAGTFCWYLFFASSNLPVAANAPQVGTPAPAFSLVDQAGRTLDSASLRSRNLVLVFYRGFW